MSNANENIEIEIKKIIEFFDEKPRNSKGHSASIIAVAGEDLGAGAFKHYIERHKINAKVNIMPDSVTTGKRTGSRLDRWIDVAWPDKTGTIFQTEIKSWSAHGIGGNPLSSDASPEEKKKFAIKKWRENWDTSNNLPCKEVSKVLIPMKKPQGVDPSHNIEPLVIHWFTIHPGGDDEPFFYQKINNDDFHRVWFFSVSAYFRNLDEKTIKLYMPNVTQRIAWLLEMFKV